MLIFCNLVKSIVCCNIKPIREMENNISKPVLDHFEDILDMIGLGKGAKRGIDDVKLSRYACYFIVQNADPGKEIVALGQTYFAVQTRLQELQQMEVYQQLNTQELITLNKSKLLILLNCWAVILIQTQLTYYEL